MTCRCAPVAPNSDRQIYFVLCDFGYCRTTGKHIGLEWVARDPARMNLRETIGDIRSGELPNVVQVIELNSVEFSSRDVTEDVLTEVDEEVFA